jgi:hypothetical protein
MGITVDLFHDAIIVCYVDQELQGLCIIFVDPCLCEISVNLMVVVIFCSSISEQ